jgi:hypothetical protein
MWRFLLIPILTLALTGAAPLSVSAGSPAGASGGAPPGAAGGAPNTAATAVQASRVCPPDVAFGEVIQCSISAPAEVDRYTFPGAVGDQVLVRVVVSPGSGDLHPGWGGVAIHRPNGDLLCNNFSYPGTELGCALDAAGRHTILIKDNAGTGTGAYSLSLTCLNANGTCGGTVDGTVGGKGFAIDAGPAGSAFLTWTGGTQQTGYQLFRLSLPSRTPAVLPPGPALPPTDTSFVDGFPPAADPLHCYALLALGPDVVPPTGADLLANSDLLCLAPNTHTLPISNFTLRLNQSTKASVTWEAPGGQAGYRLVALPLNGRAPRLVPLPPTATSAMDETGGVPTCYVLVVLGGPSGTLGRSDALCAIPGFSRFPIGATGANPQGHSADAVVARARAAVGGLDGTLQRAGEALPSRRQAAPTDAAGAAPVALPGILQPNR